MLGKTRHYDALWFKVSDENVRANIGIGLSESEARREMWACLEKRNVWKKRVFSCFSCWNLMGSWFICSILWMTCSFTFFFKIFNWSIVTILCWFLLYRNWISHKYTYNSSQAYLRPPSPHPTPLCCHRAPIELHVLYIIFPLAIYFMYGYVYVLSNSQSMPLPPFITLWD